MAPAVDRVLKALKGLGLTPEQEDDLAVAVSEALSNAAVHGNGLRAGTYVEVRVAVEPRAGVVVEVGDSGPGFDTLRVSDPTDKDHLLVPGGRGVFIMRRLVDRVEYNASGNRVRLSIAPQKLRH